MFTLETGREGKRRDDRKRRRPRMTGKMKRGRGRRRGRKEGRDKGRREITEIPLCQVWLWPMAAVTFSYPQEEPMIKTIGLERRTKL